MYDEFKKLEREATLSERMFFLQNPSVGGYAAPDNKIVHNPYNNFTQKQRDGITINEGTRIFLRNHPLFRPTYDLTPYQKETLGGYSSNKNDVIDTIAGRYFSRDSSIVLPSSEQINQLEMLRNIGNMFRWK